MALRQNQVATWEKLLEWEGRKDTSGGILSCDVGFGKTYLMALLCRDSPKKPTLITVPKSVQLQWIDVLRSVGGGDISTYVVSSSKDDNLGVMITISDVVLCTHGCLKCVDDPDLSWGRLIVDEAHVAKNAKTSVYAQLTRISSRSESKWFLTATPIHNCVAELVALSKLVGFASSDASLLREHAVIMDDEDNNRRDLPEVTVQVVHLKMPPDSHEAAVYKMAHDRYTARQTEEGDGSRSTLIMALQMRCRFAATHPNMYHQSLERHEVVLDQSVNKVEATDSTKIAYLVKSLMQHQEENAVVFCEWRDEMDLVISALVSNGIRCFEYHGGMDMAERAMVFLKFQQAAESRARKHPLVLLMQLRCSACGIDGLQSHISRVYFMRPYWNPALEKQAIGRIHRQGQKRPVCVTKLVLDDTIDEICLGRQSSKLDCIEEALLNTSMRSMILGSLPDHGSATWEADKVGTDTEACAAAHG
jgi:SNF2 family DNA or RNA helicase